MQQLTISGIVIDVVRKDIKNLHLSVHPPTGRVRIATPLHVNDEAVRLFAISKLAWIKKHQARFEAQPRQSPREYVSGESHYLWGDRYLLQVIFHEGRPQVVVRNKKYIDLYVREGSDQRQREHMMTEWYRAQLKAQVPSLLAKWEATIGVKTAEWQVKTMKTRWGTCNSEARRIWLNLDLAKKPSICLEYIIVHELVHLLERHHNDCFVGYMNQFMPQWRSYKEELNSFPLKHADWSY